MLQLWNNSKIKFTLITGIIIILILGCQISHSISFGQTITREQCEKDPTFVYIPEGKFIQGSDRQERDYGYQISAQAITKLKEKLAVTEANSRKSAWFEREIPRQTTYLPEFCLSRNLVTNEEYREFMLATNYRSPGITETVYQQQGFLVHPYSKVTEFLWHARQYPQGKGKHPVVLISYEDALAYANWKSQQTGAKYRLPTAKEWEKAARSHDGRYFPWGNRWQENATNWGSKLNYTSAIASYPLSQSFYGVEDMAGNVFEFTSTLKQEGTSTVSIMKGCSWDDLPGFCRSAYQHTRPITSRHILFGFRLVKS